MADACQNASQKYETILPDGGDSDWGQHGQDHRRKPACAFETKEKARKLLADVKADLSAEALGTTGQTTAGELERWAS